MVIFGENVISEDIFVEPLEIFGEIFEDFWILFGALIRAVRVDRAVRVVRVVGVARAVGARALYRVESKISLIHVLTATEETSQD